LTIPLLPNTLSDMSISPLIFNGNGTPGAVSTDDTNKVSLRKLTTAPLTHDDLDDNFQSISEKINDLVGAVVPLFSNWDTSNPTSPTQQLTLQGYPALKVLSNDGLSKYQFYPHDNGYLYINDETQTRIVISDVGFVGIGTGTPGNPLEVQTVGAKYGLSVCDSANQLGGLYVSDNSGSGGLDLYLKDRTAGTTKSLIASTPNLDSYFNNGGNVGIGTDDPECQLDSTGTIRAITGAQVAPSHGEGLEMFHNGVRGYLIPYDRDTSTYGDVQLGTALHVKGDHKSTVFLGATGSPEHKSGGLKIGEDWDAADSDVNGPIAKLVVQGRPDYWNSAQIENTSTTGTGITLFNEDSGVKWSLISQGSIGGAGENNLGFHLTGAGSSTGVPGYKMSLTEDGHLSCGTDANGNQAVTLQPGYATNSYSKVFASSYLNLSLGSGSGAEPRIYLRGTGTGVTTAGDIYMASAQAANCLVIQGTTGNVGIGTNQPSARLSVLSSDPGTNSAIIENDHSEGYGLKTIGGGNTTTRYLADFRDKDGVSGLKIDGDRNVDIGGNLDVGGIISGDASGLTNLPSSAASSGIFTNQLSPLGGAQQSPPVPGADTVTLSAPDPTLRFSDSTNTGDMTLYWQAAASASTLTAIGGSGKGGLYFYRNADPQVFPRDVNMMIDLDGKVGIGTDNPTHSLTIGDGTSNEWIKIDGEEGHFSVGTGSISNGKKYFSLYDSESNNHRLTISEEGNVGIGTVTPVAPLEIKGPDGPVTTSNDAIVIRAASTAHILTMGTDSSTGTSWIRPVQENVGNNKLLLDATEVGISSSETTGLLLVNPDSAATNDSNDPPAILFQASGWDTNAGSEGYRARIRVKGGYSGAPNRGNTHPVMHFDLETNEDNPDDALSTKMVINADGNVGIGTDLDDIDSDFGLSIHNRAGILVRNIQGALNSQTNIIRGSISDRYDQDDWGVGINQVVENNSNGFGMAFWTRNAYNGSYSEKVRIDKDGQVGIGTDNPASFLHVAGGASNNQALFESTDGTSSIQFKDPAGTAEFGNKGDDAVIMPAGVEKMRIKANGNVGIGTDEPNAKLCVHSETTTAYGGSVQDLNNRINLRNEVSTDGLHQNVGISFELKTTGNGFSRYSWIGSVQDQANARYSSLVFGTDEGTSAQPNRLEKMRITYDGKVGIGTDSPSRTLTTAGNFRLEKTAADGSHDALDVNVGGGADHPELNIYDKEGDAGVFIVTATTVSNLTEPRVGIGKTSPSVALDIDGDVAIDGNLATTNIADVEDSILTNMVETNGKVTFGGTAVNSIDFTINGTTLEITTS